jgi:hypothetical protein
MLSQSSYGVGLQIPILLTFLLTVFLVVDAISPDSLGESHMISNVSYFFF